MSKPDDIAYEYVGKDGEHMATVPATDITFADLENLSPIGLRDLAHSPLYKAAGPRVAKLQQEPSDEAPVTPDAKAPKGDKE